MNGADVIAEILKRLPENQRQAIDLAFFKGGWWGTHNIKVGYPDKPRDYSSVEIRDDDLVGNVRRAAVADWAGGSR